MAQWWSHEANGTILFYKLQEHLYTYYKTWTEHQQSKCTLIASEIQQQPNTRRITLKHHIATVLGAASRQNPGVQNNSSTFTAPAVLQHIETVQQPVDNSSMQDIQMTISQSLPST